MSRFTNPACLQTKPDSSICTGYHALSEQCCLPLPAGCRNIAVGRGKKTAPSMQPPEKTPLTKVISICEYRNNSGLRLPIQLIATKRKKRKPVGKALPTTKKKLILLLLTMRFLAFPHAINRVMELNDQQSCVLRRGEK